MSGSRHKVEDLLERLISISERQSEQRQSDPRLVDHMADCVLDRQETKGELAEIRRELKGQNHDNELKHKENSERLDKLKGMLIAAMVGLIGTLVMQILTLQKDHPTPAAIIEHSSNPPP